MQSVGIARHIAVRRQHGHSSNARLQFEANVPTEDASWPGKCSTWAAQAFSSMLSQEVFVVSKQTILFPEPCHEDWDRMKPEGRAKFCASCSKQVHDLTNYTPEEADHLLTGSATPACVRASILPDGQVLTRPSLVGRILMAAVVTPAIAAALTSPVMADTSTGSIVGAVQTHATRVKVTVFGTGVHRSVKVDGLGNYYLGQLPPGTYRLVFSVPHAQTWTLNDVEVTAGNATYRSSRDPQLPIVPPPPMMVTAGMPALPPIPPKPAEPPKQSAQQPDSVSPAASSSSSKVQGT
jgi:hypothetical protein